MANCRKDEPTVTDVDVVWCAWFKYVRGVESQVKLTDLAKAKWPKLYTQILRNRGGPNAQALVTGLLDADGIEIVDVECEKQEDGQYDVDILVKSSNGSPVPIQVMLFHGNRVYDSCKSVQDDDTNTINKKIRQTPPGGITLFFNDRRATYCLLTINDDWCRGMDGKCVVLYENKSGEIYDAGGPVDTAKRICRALGSTYTNVQTVKPC